MSKRLRVTSRVSKRGRSLRPRSFPPRSPTSSKPAPGELDFDSSAPAAESFPPPEVEDEDSEGDSSATDDFTPTPLYAETASRPAAQDDEEALEAPNAPQETVDADASGHTSSSSKDREESASVRMLVARALVAVLSPSEDPEESASDDTQASSPQDAQPSSPEDAQPSASEDAQPSAYGDVLPSVSGDAQPSASEDAEAGAAQDAEASSSQDESGNEGEGPIEPPPASTDAFSGEFFRKETDSVPPSVDASHAETEDAGAPRPISPEAIAYQARLRKIVAGVLGGVGLLALVVAGKALLAPPRAAAPPARPPPAHTVELAAAPEPAPQPPPAAKPPEPAKPEASASPEAAPPPAPSSSAATDTPPASAEPKAAEAPPVDIIALKKETENLMNRGKFKDAIEKARVAIVADPSDALPYLYLGSSLQETGKWKEGVEAYSECVRHATKGPVNECRAMGGRK